MDDDLRSRFRGGRRSYDAPKNYQGSAAPSRPQVGPPVQPLPQPVANRSVHAPAVRTEPPAPLRPRQPVASEPKPTIKRRQDRQRFSKKVLWGVVLVIVLACAGAVYAFTKNEPVAPTPDVNNAVQAPTPTGTIRMIATGDNLAFESVNNAAKTADGYNYVPMMSSFKPFFDASDIRLCNQTTPAGGEALGVSGSPVFNAPTAWSTSLADLGCNLINLASDHANDKGQPVIDATVSSWENKPAVLAFAGANKSVQEQVKVRYFTVKQVKFAYLAYTTKTQKTDNTLHGLNLYNSQLAKTQIEEARKNANLVIVSMAWGNEGQEELSPEQNSIAEELTSYGVDVIVGSGPRVVQTAKILNGQNGRQTLVWFSLGNFLNSQLPLNNLVGGMAVMDFDIATGNVKDPKLLPTYMHYEWTAQQKTANNLNARTNLKLYPLDQAAEPLAKSQNNTTVAEQTARITGIITKFAPIKVITSAEF